ncbi:hypothetical protein [Herpetosiphon giganteus]|uniref:hypothetical protein n=1 Tax=Herpetosiphon giganteus TaxID=2029754 RepID=UPI00195CBFF2|nr:hypothetical protein [Herpetosiphon giganteus]MBM7846283.1 hypothetical protein [Herpetosiphon giganteus]
MSESTCIIGQLPFCLYLEDAWYTILVPELSNSETIEVKLTKFRRPKEKIDYKSFWGAEHVGRGELWNDKNGTFRRTEFVILFPPSIIVLGQSLQNSYFGDDVDRIIDCTVTVLNRLIRIYRYVTQDTYIPFIDKTEIWNSFSYGVVSRSSEGQLQGNIRNAGYDVNLVNTIQEYDHNIHHQISQMLITEDKIPLYEELLISARYYLSISNWRMACVEIQTCFEVFVSEIVREYYVKKGKTLNQITNILDCGLKNLIKDHMNKVLSKQFDTNNPIYNDWLNKTYNIRNKIVHEGYQVAYEEAIESILAVEESLEYLIQRPKQKSWTKGRPIVNVNEFIVPDNNNS